MRYERKKRFKFTYGCSGGVCHPETRWCDNVVLVVGFVAYLDFGGAGVVVGVVGGDYSIFNNLFKWQGKKTVRLRR